jgi:hypothetical protein
VGVSTADSAPSALPVSLEAEVWGLRYNLWASPQARKSKKTKAKVLGFTFIFFGESSVFNALQRKK